ncbi:hypothetical protein RRF57_001514 [Xylaria bambusicola]|uniref:Uncharacterized protein n=1 Tax=Xylaria bambusicola TaxID=326684 RepID=A0AAN7UC01_9PEZI
MHNQYEALVQAKLDEATQDKRAQPWKLSVNIQAAVPSEEWVKVNPTRAAESTVDARANLFPVGILPVGGVDVRTNAFPVGILPVGGVDVRTNAFPVGILPVGGVDVRTNAFPVGILPVGGVDVRTNAFPIGILPVG